MPSNQHTLSSVCPCGDLYQCYMLCEYMKRNENEKSILVYSKLGWAKVCTFR